MVPLLEVQIIFFWLKKMMENGETEGRELAKQELRDLAIKLDKMNQADAWSTVKEIRDDSQGTE